MHDGLLRLFLGGDVMTGRGIDQILPHPGNPRLYEAHIRDARSYVEFAERVNGPIPRPAGFSRPWGDVPSILDAIEPDIRIINLETSVTRSDDVEQGKPVGYRMSPDNIASVAVIRPDVCALANNHVLDFGRRGLAETLDTLQGAHLPYAGAGCDSSTARRPAAVDLDETGRVLVFAYGDGSAGVPRNWAATYEQPGVNVLPDLSMTAAADVVEHVRGVRRPGDLAVVSIHWGSNWGYEVPPEQIGFAHALIDGGIDLVHGHSSHHPRPVEIYRDKLILYGCGDLINDYEGIGGREDYRGDLRLLYVAELGARTGRLRAVRVAPMQTYQFSLRHASRDDAAYIGRTLGRISGPFGVRCDEHADGQLYLRAR